MKKTNAEIIKELPSLTETVKKYNLLSDKKFSKKLGQNFLLDYNITKKIVSLSDNLENKTIIEVGAGPGGLTRAILEENPLMLHVIDMDPKAIEIMNGLKEKIPNVIVHHENALKFELDEKQKFFILSNLPYNIGTELLIRWLKNINNIAGMVLMFQKEVADRITAEPNSKKYGRLSIISQYCCNIENGFNLDPKYFTPPPKVTSSVLKFSPKENVNLEKLKLLEQITQIAFSSRRKMIGSNLKNHLSTEDFIKLDLNPKNRAENLSLQDFLSIVDYIENENCSI